MDSSDPSSMESGKALVYCWCPPIARRFLRTRGKGALQLSLKEYDTKSIFTQLTIRCYYASKVITHLDRLLIRIERIHGFRTTMCCSLLSEGGARVCLKEYTQCIIKWVIQ